MKPRVMYFEQAKRSPKERLSKAMANLIVEVEKLGFSASAKLSETSEGHVKWVKRKE